MEKVVRKALGERKYAAAPVLTLFRRVFDLAVMRECRDSNPADAVARVLPNLSAPPRHHPSVPYEEAPAAFAAVQEFGRVSPSLSGLIRAQAMQVLILTGKRTAGGPGNTARRDRPGFRALDDPGRADEDGCAPYRAVGLADAGDTAASGRL